MNNQSPAPNRFIAQDARSDSVDGLRQLLLRLSPVHRGVRRRIDDDAGLHTGQQPMYGIRIRQIAIMLVYSDHFAQWCQRALQLETDLAIFAGKNNPHVQAPYCLPSHSR